MTGRRGRRHRDSDETHANLIELRSGGKAIWSEKPIALDLARRPRVTLWRETPTVQMGFMRRFDPVSAAKELMLWASGGSSIPAYSRDTYRRGRVHSNSGGSFLDMSVHDFDSPGSSSAKSRRCAWAARHRQAVRGVLREKRRRSGRTLECPVWTMCRPKSSKAMPHQVEENELPSRVASAAAA